MPSLSNSYKQYGSGKVCRLTYLTDCFKHIDAVQDLPAEPVRHSLLCRSLVSTFSRKTLQGKSTVFSSGRLLDLSRSNSLVILSLRYLIYIHRLSNLRTLSTVPNYLIRMLRTLRKICLQTITILPNKFGCLRHTKGYVLETLADTLRLLSHSSFSNQ